MDYYKNFDALKAVARWAGVIGVIQSILWIGLSVVGILAYNCIIGYTNSNVNYGSITMFTFYHIYFQGSCRPDGYPTDLNLDILKATPPTLDPSQIFIWICVYCGVSVLWFISSVLLATGVRQSNLGATNVILYFWALVTLGISGMDVAQGVIYGLDYNKYMNEAYKYNLLSSQAGAIVPEAVVLISAQIASITMMVIAFRGFVMWIANVAFVSYFYKETFVINEVLNSDENLYTDYSKDSNSILSRGPINAFEPPRTEPLALVNPSYEPDRTETLRINITSAERAARMSSDNLQERRLRNLNNFEQYPPTRPSPPRSATEPAFPAPDYTPPMPRANQSHNQLKNTRFQ